MGKKGRKHMTNALNQAATHKPTGYRVGELSDGIIMTAEETRSRIKRALAKTPSVEETLLLLAILAGELSDVQIMAQEIRSIIVRARNERR